MCTTAVSCSYFTCHSLGSVISPHSASITITDNKPVGLSILFFAGFVYLGFWGVVCLWGFLFVLGVFSVGFLVVVSVVVLWVFWFCCFVGFF